MPRRCAYRVHREVFWEPYETAVRQKQKASGPLKRESLLSDGLDLLDKAAAANASDVTDLIYPIQQRILNSTAQKHMTMYIKDSDEDRFQKHYAFCANVRNEGLFAACVVVLAAGI